MMRNVVRLVGHRHGGSGAAAQPVVPLAFLTVRSKPPSKKPQLMPAALSRSPMFLSAHRDLRSGGGGANVADRIGVADQGVSAAAVRDDVSAGV